MKVQFPAATPAPVERHHNGRADQGVAMMAWPATDEFERQTHQDLRVLEQVFSTRLTDQLRIRDGATYSPDTMLGASKVFPGFGYLLAVAELPAAKMPMFFSESQSIAADLRSRPISDDELERARKPVVETFITQQQTNQYWVNAFSGVQSDPRRIEVIRDTIPDLKRVTAANVQRSAEKFLTDAKAFKVVITPDPKR